MIRLAPTFINTVAQAEIPIVQLAREAGVAESTIHALLNPDQHPHRKGGMHRTTAWKLANAFARRAQITPPGSVQRTDCRGNAVMGAALRRDRGASV